MQQPLLVGVADALGHLAQQVEALVHGEGGLALAEIVVTGTPTRAQRDRKPPTQIGLDHARDSSV